MPFRSLLISFATKIPLCAMRRTALAGMGREVKAAIPLLTELFRDPDEGIRRSAPPRCGM